LESLWWLLLLGPLLLLQRRLHFEAQALLLLLTRRHEIAQALFALLLFPGVLLHEVSHFLVARLLGVRTGRVSLLPQAQAGGRLRLGYVETASTDLLRDGLIGLAPLLAGGVFVAYAGSVHLGLSALWESAAGAPAGVAVAALAALPGRPDFWLWFYLTFTVSSTMLPSASDRRAWLPLGLILAAGLGVGWLVGAGPWLAQHAAPLVLDLARALALVLGITVGLHLVLLPPAWVLRVGLSRLTGLEVS
jgi:hypothetical protein